MRGLDPAKYSREDNIVIFLGVSSYVGEMRGKQDDLGHIFGSSILQQASVELRSAVNIVIQLTFERQSTWRKVNTKGRSETPMSLQ